MAADEGQVLNYCKLAQGAYAAYDSHNGTCRFPLADLLPSVGLGGNGYVATSFLYATVNILAGDVVTGGVNEENDCPHRQHWIGYVALATDAERDRVGYRDIAVVWRGTSALDELLKDLQAVLVPIHGDEQALHANKVLVERGFDSLYTSSCDACGIRTSARSQVLAELSRLVTYLRNKYPGENIRVTTTGHSLGGALSLLAAWDAADPAPAAAALAGVVVRAVTFAAPRVGNQAFCDELVAGQRHVSVQRVIVDRDVVPTLPPTFFGYADAGNNVRLLNAGNVPLPFLTLLVPWHFHGIKQYLSLLDPASPALLLPAVPGPVPADHLLPVPEAELDNMIEFH